MSLDFLGRGEKQKAVRGALCHVFGGIVGGAMTGGLLGWLGSLFPFQSWHIWLIIVLATLALWQSMWGQSFKLGRHCQVNRRWKYAIPLELGYFFWGWQLGCGILTLIPYSSYIVLLGVQFTSGIVAGLLSGAFFGGSREAVVLFALWHKPTDEIDPRKFMRLLPALAPIAQRLNRTWILFGTLLFILVGLH